MAYRYDPDLEFLSKINSKDLNELVHCLTHDKDGSSRFTETLTLTNGYKRYYPDHHQYWQDIAEEVQKFGGNTFVNLFRGNKGVLYKEVLCDVCDKMKVNYNKASSTKQIEQNLLMKILQSSLEKMSPKEIEELAKELGVEDLTHLTPQVMTSVFLAIFKAGGFKSYQLTLIIVNAVMKAVMGRGLSIIGNSTLARILGILTGPIGWTITGVWTLIDVAGAAYRVTIPAVIQIAYLRALNEMQNTPDFEEKIKSM